MPVTVSLDFNYDGQKLILASTNFSFFDVSSDESTDHHFEYALSIISDKGFVYHQYSSSLAYLDGLS